MKRIFAQQVIVGVVVGVLLAAISGFIAYQSFCSSHDCVSGGFFSDAFSAAIVAILVGTFLGLPIGVTLGVCLVGKLIEQRGSFWLAFLGSYLGTVASFPLGWIPAVILAPVFATLGFHLRAILKDRKQKSNPTRESDLPQL